MSQDASERPRPIPARPADGAPARPRSPRPDPAQEGKPTPVRASMEGTEQAVPPTVEPDVASVAIEVAGATWVVRVRGRSLVGRTTPVLLLSFEREGDADGIGLEGWVVGRALAEVPSAALEGAVRNASPPREPGRRPFFDEGSRRERRDG